MGFLSFKFILFIGLSFVLYFLVPKKYQWLVLLVMSYLYYYLNSHLLVGVLFIESVFVYLIGRLLAKLNNQLKNKDLSKEEKNTLNKKKKSILSIGVIGVLMLLVVIKYSDFMITNLNYLFNGNLSLFNFVLPLGISFYTLQSISYMVDVSKNKVEAENNVLHFMLYMAYFPQIIQGPIPRFKSLAHQLFEEHDYDYQRVTQGLQLMLWGIAKKVIIADRIGKPVQYFFDNYSSFSGIAVILGAICYGFQVYADFSGGIDAIKGISEVFGIYLDDNFRQPYFSKSVEEFWRRWHISLGAWMRDYIFYPLSLSKLFNNISKKARAIFNDKVGKKLAPSLAMFIVYFLVGLWHGADWKYTVYGIWNGLFIMSGIFFEEEYQLLNKTLHINTDSKWFNCFRIFRTFIICSIGRIFSRSINLSAAFYTISSIFKKPFDFSYLNSELLSELGLDYKNWILLGIMIFIVLLIDYLKEKGIDIRKSIAQKNIAIRWALYIALIVAIMVFGLYGGEYDASSFIYGKF